MNILIAGAWPYANGPLHIGHIASLLPGDVIARFYRQNGDQVSYVSGSDCYGTPITLRAKKEGKSPAEIADYYHEDFCRCFERLGFSYDDYGKTSSPEHRAFVTDFHKNMYQSKSVYEKETKQAYCGRCEQFLPDRFVKGLCPNCGTECRGDQCERCNHVYDSIDLTDPICAECGQAIELRDSVHLYLKLSDFEKDILGLIDDQWRKNAIDFTTRYFDAGIRDRAITRDIDWGIDVPKEGYENKKIYIWAENVLGYLSGNLTHCRNTSQNFDAYFRNERAVHYYVHGKDNVPFHSIILPALLLAEGTGYHLPDIILSSEFMTLEGLKISTSKNHAVWITDLLEKYHPDSIRYFFIANAPEKRDADFSFNAFINCNNGELVGVYGNFVNRTLVFVEKYFEGMVPQGQFDKEIKERIIELYKIVSEDIRAGRLKQALFQIFEFIHFSNKYFDAHKPWDTRNSDPVNCQETIFNCIQIIANLCVLLEPFLPFSSKKVAEWFGLEIVWELKNIECGTKVKKSEILFNRIDKTTALQ